MSFDSLMNSTCDIEEATVTTGAMGGKSETWAAVVEDAPCRIAMLSARERAGLGAVGVSITHRMFCRQPTGVTITEKMRVTSGGKTYGIQAVNDPHGMGHHLQLDLLEIR